MFAQDSKRREGRTRWERLAQGHGATNAKASVNARSAASIYGTQLSYAEKGITTRWRHDFIWLWAL